MLPICFKKIAIPSILTIMFFNYLPTLIPHKTLQPSPIIHETLFIDIITELKLLDSWLPKQSYPKNMLNTIWYTNFQEILAYYAVDQMTFEASVKFYLTTSIDQTIDLYAKIDNNLKKLLFNIYDY